MNLLCRGFQNCGIWLFGLLVLSGCGSTTPIHYYQLTALPYSATEETALGVEKGIVVGVGPVEIPSYVDRAHLVVRASETELELLEFDRWAEPLQRNLTRVLIDNLSQLLERHGATVLRWDEGLPLDYRVRIEFTQFDFSGIGEVSLTARWIVLGNDSEKALMVKTSRFTSSGLPDDYGSLVSEMSRHVDSLSREISQALIAHIQ